MKKLILLFIVVIGTQCSKMNVPQESVSFENNWSLEKLIGFSESIEGNKGRPVLKINLEEHRYSGNSGCNSISGEFRFTKGGGVNFLPGLMTKMACNDNGLERAFINALENTDKYKIEADKLQFFKGTDLTAIFKLKSQE